MRRLSADRSERQIHMSAPQTPLRGTLPQPDQHWLTTAGEAIGLIAGLVAIVYFLGGLVYALRLGFDGFALEAIVGLIGQLPRESVITAGFVEGLGPAVLVGIVAALGYGARDRPKPRNEEVDLLNKGPHWRLKLFGLLLPTFALVAPAILLAIDTEGVSGELVTSVLGFGVTYSMVCAGWFALRLLGKKHGQWYRLTHSAAAGVVWTGMALVPSVMFGAAVVFESARVCVRDRSNPVAGDLIAETKDRILLAREAGGRKTVVSLPASRVRRVEYGDLPARTECPEADPKG